MQETNKNLDEIVQLAKELQQSTGVKLLWGTANLFSHPRYMNGAATNPDLHAFAYAAAQVKKAIEVTQFLGGENYGSTPVHFLTFSFLGWKRRLPVHSQHQYQA